MRTEWVIHIWGKKRDNLELTAQEKFHMDMIRRCKYTTIFDKVLINISMDDINDDSLFSFLKVNLLDTFSGIKEIDIRKCKNDAVLCEYVTFRPYVWDRIGENVRIFYSHFKGYPNGRYKTNLIIEIKVKDLLNLSEEQLDLVLKIKEIGER